MKNKAIDLHNILFEQLERLNDENIKGEDLLVEFKRAEAMNKVAGQIIANGNIVLNAMRIANEVGMAEIPDMLSGGTQLVQIPKKTRGN